MNREEAIKKSLEGMIERGWLTKNEHLVIDAVVMDINIHIAIADLEYQDHRERQMLFELLQKHYPKKFDQLFKKEEK